MTIDFTGLHVVVTGGAGALGAAIVQMLIESGATCHIPAHRPPDPASFALAKHARVKVASGVDLTDESAVTQFYTSLPTLWASVHTAGGFAMSPIANTSLSDFRKMLDTNTVTCFLCCREAVKKIRGLGHGGRIVNVGSKPSLIPTAGMVSYAASKAAVASITQSLSEELAGERIWVNAVIPSIMDTPANRAAMPKADYSKWPRLEEVAATVAFLASPQNVVTRGALVPVYGMS